VVDAERRSSSVVDTDTRKVGRTLRLRRPLGGLVLSRSGSRALVAPGPGATKAVLVSTGRAKAVKRVSAGRGPGWVSLSPTDARVFFANGGSGTITFASGFSYKRLPGRIRVGHRIVALAVQPGYSLLIGTPGPDRLTGDRGADLIRGLAGDDVLNGFRGDDIIEGDEGNDTLIGGIGNDQLDGGPGDD